MWLKVAGYWLEFVQFSLRFSKQKSSGENVETAECRDWCLCTQLKQGVNEGGQLCDEKDRLGGVICGISVVKGRLMMGGFCFRCPPFGFGSNHQFTSPLLRTLDVLLFGRQSTDLVSVWVARWAPWVRVQI